MEIAKLKVPEGVPVDPNGALFKGGIPVSFGSVINGTLVGWVCPKCLKPIRSVYKVSGMGLCTACETDGSAVYSGGSEPGAPERSNAWREDIIRAGGGGVDCLIHHTKWATVCRLWRRLAKATHAVTDR